MILCKGFVIEIHKKTFHKIPFCLTDPYWRGGRALGFNQFPFDFQARLARPTAKPGNTISQSSQFNPSNQRREAFESIGPSLQSRRFR